LIGMAKSKQDPLHWFAQWFKAAQKAGIHNAEAMTLATVTRQGRPAARVVLFKGMTRGGFSFFTNFESPKARELAAHPRAALVFHWDPLERQIRVEGRVVRCTKAESEKYFATRPRISQLGAWASDQSSVIPGRATLEAKLAEAERRFEGVSVPRPPHWGGFIVVPERIEFWQGREFRLHDRTLFTRKGKTWKSVALSP
jgi:pyridoxamine 5'-phosphate oxidase